MENRREMLTVLPSGGAAGWSAAHSEASWGEVKKNWGLDPSQLEVTRVGLQGHLVGRPD